MGKVTLAQYKAQPLFFLKWRHNLNTCEMRGYDLFTKLPSLKEFNQFWFQWRVLSYTSITPTLELRQSGRNILGSATQ